MSWPCVALCAADEFCDVITQTCIGCSYVCDPKYKTPDECSRSCPEWRATTPTVPSAKDPGSRGESGGEAWITGLVVVIVVLIIAIVAIVVLVLKKQKKCGGTTDVEDQNQPPGACIKDAKTRNATVICCCCCNDTDLSFKRVDTTSGSQTTNLINKNSTDSSCDSHYTSFNCESNLKSQAEYTPEEKQSKKVETTSRKSETNNSHTVLESNHSSKTPPSNNSSSTATYGTENNMTTVSQASSKRAPSMKLARNPSQSRTMGPHSSRPQLRMTGPTSSNRLPTFISEMTNGRGLSLNFHSDRPFSGGPMVRSTELTSQGAGHWHSVMRVYDHIDQKLHELPWIAGCMIGNTNLKIVVTLDPSNSNKDHYTRRIRNIVPADIASERFLLTFEGPALQTTNGSFGSGSMVHVRDRHGHTLSSTVTALGRATAHRGDLYIPQTYGFTSGHTVQSDMTCKLQSNCDASKSMLQARCVAHVNTLGSSIKRDIKTKVYDLAMVRTDQETSITNSRQFLLSGQQLTIRFRINRTPIRVHDLPPCKKVLVFGGPHYRILEGILDPVEPSCTCVLPDGRQVVNLIQLSSRTPGDRFILPGHSGSLVAWCPSNITPAADNSITVDAFAVVSGINADCETKGYALPLWDQMSELFSKDKQFSEFGSKLKFEDYVEDSGAFSLVNSESSYTFLSD